MRDRSNQLENVVEFDGVLSPSCIHHLVIMFIKHILYQRGQIPLQLDIMKTYIDKFNAPNLAVDSTSQVVEPVSQVVDPARSENCSALLSAARAQRMKEREMGRQRRREKRLVNRADKFLQSFQLLEKTLIDSLKSFGSQHSVYVTLALGPSVYSIRETYSLVLPSTGLYYNSHPRRVTEKRGVLQLFRKLVMCDNFVPARTLTPTCLHVLLNAPHSSSLCSPLSTLTSRPHWSVKKNRAHCARIYLRHAVSEAVPSILTGSELCCCHTATSSEQFANLCCAGSTKDGASQLQISGLDLMDDRSDGSDSTGVLRHSIESDSASQEQQDIVADTNDTWWQIPVSVRGFKNPS